MRRAALLASAMLLAAAGPVPAQPFFDDASSRIGDASGGRSFSMAAAAADLDGDGDLDLAVASEYAPNRILLNDGAGSFGDVSDARLSRRTGDHEDVAIADFDGDGDLDLVFVGEDDQVYGYHLNDGCGVFEDVTDRLPRRGTSNAVVAGDYDRDGDADLYIGNNGQDFLFVNDGTGRLADATGRSLPPSADITQDAAAGDVDGDGDLDLALGNEDGNILLINDGKGVFASGALLPRGNREETRDADLEDVDGDGDLDLYFANTRLFTEGADPQDRLLLNDGGGGFADATATHLPAESEPTMTAAFVDFDGDGDPDLVTGSIGDLSGRTATMPYRAFRNDGSGRFSAAPEALPSGTAGNGFDIEAGDFDGDGRLDLFLASRGGPDRLLLGIAGARNAETAAPVRNDCRDQSGAPEKRPAH